jgi:hypothetical protein
MPTLEELFRNKKYDRLEGKTPQEAFAVRNSKDIQISTISPLLNATSVKLINKVRLGSNAERFRETRVESELIGLLPFSNFSSAILYGTDILRISSQNTSLGEAMKAGTGGRGLVATAARVVGDTVGEAVQFGGSRLLKVPSTFNAKTAITRAGAAIKNTLGSLFPDVLIPSKIVASPAFTAKVPGFNEEYRVHETLANLKAFSSGTKLASFLAKNATGTPDQIKQAVIGQGLNIAQQQTKKFVSKQLVKVLSKGGDRAQQMAKELQQSQVVFLRWSSLKKYSDVVKGERQFGKPPLNFRNEESGYIPPDTNVEDRVDLSTKYLIEFTGDAEEAKAGKRKFLKEKNQNKSEYLDGTNTGVWMYSHIPRQKTRDGGLGVFKPDYKTSNNKDEINKLRPSHVDVTEAGVKTAEDNERADMIPLKFISISNSTQVQFRGAITSLSEQFSPSWESSRFIGSPFSLYTYQSIERTVQFSFRVFSLSSTEHKINWEKISYLSSLCYPQEYKGAAGAITAPFLKFTMGDLYREKECFIENMSYSVDDTFPWEIGLNGKDLQNYRLPMIVEVTITLKFIEAKSNTHNYVINTTTNKLEPTLLGGKLYSYSTPGEKATDLQNQKVGLNTTTKEDKAPDMAKPESEVNQQEGGDPYPQDSTPWALDIQKQYKLRKTNISHTPLGESKARPVYEQRKTGKLYFGNGEPYTGFSDNIGPDLSTPVFDNTNLPGNRPNPFGSDTTLTA